MYVCRWASLAAVMLLASCGSGENNTDNQPASPQPPTASAEQSKSYAPSGRIFFFSNSEQGSNHNTSSSPAFQYYDFATQRFQTVFRYSSGDGYYTSLHSGTKALFINRRYGDDASYDLLQTHVFDIAQGQQIYRWQTLAGTIHAVPKGSADGRYVSLGIAPPGTGEEAVELQIRDLSGQLVYTSEAFGQWAWLRNGQMLVMPKRPSSAASPYTFSQLDIATGQISPLFDLPADSSKGEPGQFSPSPDGKSLAFTWGSHIHVINIDGSGLRQVTQGALGEAYASWSPDGAYLLFKYPGFATDVDDGSLRYGGSTEAFIVPATAVRADPGSQSPANPIRIKAPFNGIGELETRGIYTTTGGLNWEF